MNVAYTNAAKNLATFAAVHLSRYEQIRLRTAQEHGVDIANVDANNKPMPAVFDSNGQLVIEDPVETIDVASDDDSDQQNAWASEGALYPLLSDYERKKILDLFIKDSESPQKLWNERHESFDEFLDRMNVPKFRTPQAAALLKQIDAEIEKHLQSRGCGFEHSDVPLSDSFDQDIVDLASVAEAEANPAKGYKLTDVHGGGGAIVRMPKAPTWNDNPIEYFNDAAAELAALGHEIDFDSRWGSSRKGYKGLVNTKRGEVALKVSTTTDGSKIVIRTEYNDQLQISVSVMYVRHGKLEISNRMGCNVDLDAQEIIEFLSPSTLVYGK